eukprot:TRINITY_DN15569_c0_g1_i2.p1 TRINITY_DN15569_c0_g1~~TRINITY_DN15569_c0_g1_i2.p1  ORF type:complete len:802 (+),score=172.10 TRINITY_DN15569_c0_g1_i2:97-2502(+)
MEASPPVGRVLGRGLSSLSDAGTPSSRSGSIRVGAILSENERLRLENAKLRELNRDSQPQKTDGGSTQVAVQPGSIAIEARNKKFAKKPGSYFRNWDPQRKRSDVSTDETQDALMNVTETAGGMGTAESLAVVPSGGSAATLPGSPYADSAIVEAPEPSPSSLAEPSPSADEVEEPPLRMGWDWIPQISLCGHRSGTCNQPEGPRKLCEAVAVELSRGCEAAALKLLTDAYEAHVADVAAPYLGFSALLPPLFALLCRTEGAQSSGDRGDQRDLSQAAFETCIRFLGDLQRLTKYGDTPPARRPDDVPRERYVREFAVQAGLALDLVRLDIVHRQKRQAESSAGRRKLQQKNSDGSHPLAMTPRTRPSMGRPTSRSRSPVRNDVEAAQAGTAAASDELMARTEFEGLLARAGRYLSAVQMDMDLLQHQAVKNARLRLIKEREARAQTERPTDEEAMNDDEGLAAEASAPAGGGEAGRDPFCLPDSSLLPLQDLPPIPAEQLPGGDAASGLPAAQDESTGDVNMVESDGAREVNLVAAPEPEQVDPLITPAFGEFVNTQLLPLYLADIPFKNLEHILDRYCGMPMDSDDEERVMKSIGRSGQARQRKLTRRRSTASSMLSNSVSDIATPMARLRNGGSSPERESMLALPDPTGSRTFSMLANAERGNKPLMRGQMLTSVAARRSKGLAEPSDKEMKSNGIRQGFKSLVAVASSKSLSTAVGTPGAKVRSKTLLLGNESPLPHGTPRVKPSAVLFSTPASAAKIATFDKASPLSTRAVTRGQATTVKKRGPAPLWSLMGETPM